MNISEPAYNKLDSIINTLKITYGLFFIVVGIDKLFNLIVHWNIYVNPLITQHVPYHQLSIGLAVLEVGVGLLILSAHTRTAAYIAAAWVLVVIVNLVTMGAFYDIAARDAVIAVGLLALAQLIDVKDRVRHTK